MIKFSNKSLLILALALAVCVAALVYQFLNDIQQQSSDMATVVVARTDILANTAITADMVEEVNISGKQLQPGAITAAGRVVGTFAKENIPAQEQLTENRILNTVAVGFTGSIPHDKRAVSIAVTDVTGVAGVVKPGDYVDVIAVVDQRSDSGPVANMIVQNVLVLATNKTVTREEPGTLAKDTQTTTVTVAVTPDEATKLGLAGKKGTVTLALRPYAPTGGGLAQVEAKTVGSLVGNAGYVAEPVSAVPSAHASAPTPNLALLQSMLPSAGKPAPGAKAHPDYSNKKVIPVIKGTTTQDVYVEK